MKIRATLYTGERKGRTDVLEKEIPLNSDTGTASTNTTSPNSVEQQLGRILSDRGYIWRGEKTPQPKLIVLGFPEEQDLSSTLYWDIKQNCIIINMECEISPTIYDDLIEEGWGPIQ